MSKPNDNGGPAFPCLVDSTQPEGYQVGNTIYQTYGVSIRDYFAGQALASMSAGENILFLRHEAAIRDARAIASAAYLIADAMIEARGKEQSNG